MNEWKIGGGGKKKRIKRGKNNCSKKKVTFKKMKGRDKY